MTSKLRASTLAIACVLAITCGPALVCAAEALTDTSRLPRVGGGKEIYASPAQTIFLSSESVAATTEAARKALTAQGWQSYEAPFTAKTDDPTIGLLSLKKGAQGLSVFVTVAPAQNNAISVQYHAVELETDLPFPKDAADIEFSPKRPYLKCTTAETVERTLASYFSELTAQGWSAWSTKTVAKVAPGDKVGELTERGAYAYFVHDGKPPVMLRLQRLENGRTRVEIETVPVEDLNPQIARDAAAAARAKEAAQQARNTHPNRFERSFPVEENVAVEEPV